MVHITGEQGCADRPAAHATFNAPTDVAVHPTTGELAVADHRNHCIRSIALSNDGVGGGAFTLAGSIPGFQDGASNTAHFNHPASIDYDADGNLYVADHDNNRVRKISPAHVVSTLAGTGVAGRRDGNREQATFSRPWGIAVDGAGAVLVADQISHHVRLISRAGGVRTLADRTRGRKDGQGAATEFKHPSAVAIDSTGGALVADFSNHRLRRIATNLVPKAWPALEATALPPVPTFNTDMGKLLDPAGGAALFHDVSFQIEGAIIHAHKNILSARCEHFATMLASGVAEGESGSGTAAPIKVADTTPAAFRALLTYIYTDTLEVDDACAVDVACLSQRYRVTPLQEACVAHCKEHVSVANAVQWLVAAHTHTLEDLRGVLLEYEKNTSYNIALLLVKMAQNLGVRCVLLPAPLVPEVPTKTRLESRFCNQKVCPILFCRYTGTHYLEIEETAPGTLDLLDDHRRLFREVVHMYTKSHVIYTKSPPFF